MEYVFLLIFWNLDTDFIRTEAYDNNKACQQARHHIIVHCYDDDTKCEVACLKKKIKSTPRG